MPIADHTIGYIKFVVSLFVVVGRLHSGTREREDLCGDKGAEREFKPRVKHGATGGGAHNGVSDASLLYPHHGRLYHTTNDACHTAHVVRISARLPASKPIKHRLEIYAHLG